MPGCSQIDVPLGLGRLRGCRLCALRAAGRQQPAHALFPLYARAYGLSALGVTLLFATYALLVIPALPLFGPLSDAQGRRVVLVAATVTAASAAGIFAAADTLWVLFAAQAVQAMALGALQGSAAPTLIENDPTGHPRRASAVASGLTVGGAAAGPLVAGALAQYAVLPLRLAYRVEVGLLAIALGAITARLPREVKRQRWRPRRPTVPAHIRQEFAIASTSAFVGWAVTGLFLSLIPAFVTTILKDDNVALAGAVVALMLGSAAVVQVGGRRLEPLRAQILGAPVERKADVVASYYVVVYLGTALPVIGVGVLATIISFAGAVEVFGYLVIAICLAGLVALLRVRFRQSRSENCKR